MRSSAPAAYASSRSINYDREAIVRINSLENHADDVFDTAIADLFDNEKDFETLVTLVCNDKNVAHTKEEIDDVYVAAKSFAKERGIPIVSPSQANRGAAKNDIIEGDNAAGSYEKIMIGDIIISLARKREDKVKGTGRWHFMKNRYGADGMTFRSKINTSNGFIEVDDSPIDDEEIETNGSSSKVNDFSNVDVEERQLLQQKFFKLEK